MSRVVLYHKPKNVTRKPVTRNTLGNTGTRVIPVPVPVISRARASGWGFSRLRARVAQKNPRAARADPYTVPTESRPEGAWLVAAFHMTC
jgi:hypothetical protein